MKFNLSSTVLAISLVTGFMSLGNVIRVQANEMQSHGSSTEIAADVSTQQMLERIVNASYSGKTFKLSDGTTLSAGKTSGKFLLSHYTTIIVTVYLFDENGKYVGASATPGDNNGKRSILRLDPSRGSAQAQNLMREAIRILDRK